MEKFRCQIVEIWNHCLLMHRTMVIKAECRRRKAAESQTRDLNAKRRKAGGLVCTDQSNQSECQNDSHSLIIDLEDRNAATSGMTTPAADLINLGWVDKCDRSEMKRVFDLIDENKDGLISAEELQLHMTRLGVVLSDQKVREMIWTVDRNRDDYVDFEEFFSLYCPLYGGEQSEGVSSSAPREDDEEDEDALLKAFFVFDENKDGLISGLELQRILLKLGLPEGRSLMGCQKMIARVDSDGDGQVDFFEFKAMMSSTALSFNSTI